MNKASSTHFDQQYQRHLKHLKLKGLQPKTIEAYARAIRRIGKPSIIGSTALPSRSWPTISPS